MSSKIIGKANMLVETTETAYLGLIDENNYPTVSTFTPVKTEGILKIYLATTPNANKAIRISRNSNASVCFCINSNNITLVGDIVAVKDKEIKEKLWQKWFTEYYPLGKDDPNYCLFEFNTKRVSLYVDEESYEATVDKFLKVQSRCGLMCDSCTFKESNGCKGCAATNGHPFYGECSIAKCCQDKGFSHCGECAQMPCKKLYEYSYGDSSEHCDRPKGARISMLKCWKDYNCSNTACTCAKSE